ncbi:hypothetical protein SC171_05315 [Pantoea cypripedii]|uniref:hypothetical protein n=1 Tax=Pantoea cypripedii TaxID=55209 RepID=UPI002FC6E48D
MLITATTSPFSTGIAETSDQTALSAPLSGVKQSHQRLFMSQLRTRAKIHGNACLEALKARFAVYWANVPEQGSIVSRVETLLFQFEQQDLLGITARELREVLLENNLRINTTTASSALATARVEVPAQEQQWIDAHWENASHKPGSQAWLQSLLQLEGCPDLKPSVMRRALLNVGVSISTSMLSDIAVATKVQVPARHETLIKAWWDSFAEEDCLMSKLVMLLRLPAYQQLAVTVRQLQVALGKIGVKVSREMMISARAAFRSKISQQQQAWFDANRAMFAGYTLGDKIENLLRHGKPPQMMPAQLWNMLRNAGEQVSFAMVRQAMRGVKAAANVIVTADQEQVIIAAWHKLCQSNISLVKLLGTILIQYGHLGITSVHLKQALNRADISVSNVAVGLALAAVKAAPTAEELSWIRPAWANINHEKMMEFRIRDLLTQSGLAQEITPAKLQRIMWEAGEDICIKTCINALNGFGFSLSLASQPEPLLTDEDQELDDILNMSLEMNDALTSNQPVASDDSRWIGVL